MGRTIHYRILAAEPVPEELWRKIESVQSAMNDRFIWTCECLSLEPVDEEKRKRFSLVRHDPSEHPVQGWGFTKTRDDELNSLLVVKFLEWVSKLLPDAQVKVHDEGDLIAPGHVILEAGKMRLDEVLLEEQRSYLERHELKDALAEVETAIEDAEEDGIYLTPPMASEYAWREDVAALDIPRSELRELTVSEVVDRMPLPWKTKRAA